MIDKLRIAYNIDSKAKSNSTQAKRKKSYTEEKFIDVYTIKVLARIHWMHLDPYQTRISLNS